MADDMRSRRISVIADDRTVVVAGEAYACPEDGLFPADLHALQWSGSGRMPGHIERKIGDSHGFVDFERMAPFVEAWILAKGRSDAAKLAAAEALAVVRKEEANALAAHEAQKVESAAAMEAHHKAEAERLAAHDAKNARRGADLEVLQARWKAELDARIAEEEARIAEHATHTATAMGATHQVEVDEKR